MIREIRSLRLLCERYYTNLGRLDREAIDTLLAELELSQLKLNTINEYMKALKQFLGFTGKAVQRFEGDSHKSFEEGWKGRSSW